MNDSFYKINLALESNDPCNIPREAESSLLEGLSNKKLCYILSPKSTGKSSLINRAISAIENDDNLCFLVNRNLIDTERWYYILVNNLSEAFQDSIDNIELTQWQEKNKLTAGIQYFQAFLDFLLSQNQKKFYIFIDEIGTFIKLSFSDGFFAFLQSFYNARNHKPEYERINFSLFGVAAIDDFSSHKNGTLFNLGDLEEKIELNGLTHQEVKELARGLKQQNIERPQKVAEVIYSWTEGQPFLTQLIFKKICESGLKIIEGREKEEVDKLVEYQIIQYQNQESISSYKGEIEEVLKRKGHLEEAILMLYQKTLQLKKQGKRIKIQNTLAEAELLLSGLVIKKDGCLDCSRIHIEIYDKEWTQYKIDELCTYKKQLQDWLDSKRNSEFLLTGIYLEKALERKNRLTSKGLGNLIGFEERDFLEASKELKQNTERQAMIRRWREGLITAVAVIAVLMGIGTRQELNRYKARIAEEADNWGEAAIEQFESEQIEALKSAIKAGYKLKNVVKKESEREKYPTVLPLLALQSIYEEIHETHFRQMDEYDVTAIDFNDDYQNGDSLAIGMENGYVLFLDTALDSKQSIDKQLEELEGKQPHTVEVTDIHLNGGTLITSGKDEKGQIWEQPNSEDSLKKFIPSSSGKGIHSLGVSKDKRFIATGEGNIIYLRNQDGTEIRHWVAHQGNINAIAFHPKAEQIATVGDDGYLRLWDYQGTERFSQQVNERLTRQQNKEINDVIFSHDGTWIATAGEDGAVIFWDLKGNKLTSFNNPFDSVISLSLNYSGDLMAIGTEDKIVELRKIPKAELKNAIAKPQEFKSIFIRSLMQFKSHKDEITDASFHIGKNILATVARDSTVRFWDLSDIQVNPTRFTQVQWSPDAQKILAIDLALGQVTSWDLETQVNKVGVQIEPTTKKGTQPLLKANSLPFDLEQQCPGKATSYAFQLDNSGEMKIMIATDKGMICLVNSSGGKLDEPLKASHQKIVSININPRDTDTFFITEKYGQEKRLRKFSWSDKKEVTNSKTVVASIKETITTDKSKFVITMLEKQIIKIWNDKLEQEKLIIDASNATFSPNGKFLAIIKSQEIGLIDLSEPDLNFIPILAGNSRQATSMSFSPDSQNLAIIEEYGTFRIWSIQNNDWLLNKWTNDPGSAEVSKIAFSPDGKLLATREGEQGKNYKIKLWDWKGVQKEPSNQRRKIAEFEGADFIFPPEETYQKKQQILIIDRDGQPLVKEIKNLDALLKDSCTWLAQEMILNPDSELQDICDNKNTEDKSS